MGTCGDTDVLVGIIPGVELDTCWLVAVAVEVLPMLSGPIVADGIGATRIAVTVASRSLRFSGLGCKSPITSLMMFRLMTDIGIPPDSKPYSASFAECSDTGRKLSDCELPA